MMNTYIKTEPSFPLSMSNFPDFLQNTVRNVVKIEAPASSTTSTTQNQPLQQNLKFDNSLEALLYVTEYERANYGTASTLTPERRGKKSRKLKDENLPEFQQQLQQEKKLSRGVSSSALSPSSYEPSDVSSFGGSIKNAKKRPRSDDDSVEGSEGDRPKKLRWTKRDIENLWSGIAKFGNNWARILEEHFNGSDDMRRSKDQIKDKGRKLLKQYKWSSGRDGFCLRNANTDAKAIAQKVLGGFA